jgi:hypothetical protein
MRVAKIERLVLSIGILAALAQENVDTIVTNVKILTVDTRRRSARDQ